MPLTCVKITKKREIPLQKHEAAASSVSVCSLPPPPPPRPNVHVFAYVCVSFIICFLWSLLIFRSLPLSVSWARRCLRCRPFFFPLSATLALHIYRVYGFSMCCLCEVEFIDFCNYNPYMKCPQAWSPIETTPSGSVPPVSSLRPSLASPCYPSSTTAVSFVCTYNTSILMKQQAQNKAFLCVSRRNSLIYKYIQSYETNTGE